MVKTFTQSGDAITHQVLSASTLGSQNGKLLSFDPIPSSSSLIANVLNQAGPTDTFQWITRIYIIKKDTSEGQTIELYYVDTKGGSYA